MVPQEGTGAGQVGGEGCGGERQVPHGLGNADAEADSRAGPKSCTDLDEEERGIGGGVAVDVNPSQDNGCHQENR